MRLFLDANVIFAACWKPEGVWVEQAETTGLPLKDTPILAAALQHKLDGLVTGDLKHFSQLLGKTVLGVEVFTPAAAIAKLIEEA
jgi:predicted nucleic acid-binding protein